MANSYFVTSIDNDYDTHIHPMIDNYIYMYHVDKFIVLPMYMDNIVDSMSISQPSTPIMQRSAPIFSYSNSGPRTITFNFEFHRDMMTQINYNVSNAPISISDGGDDYVDFIVKYAQAMAFPSYDDAEKAVNPPIVAVRMGEDVFIKGVINGAVTVTYKLPILRNGKYAVVGLSFSVSEMDPYGAEEVMYAGSFRGLSDTLERKII